MITLVANADFNDDSDYLFARYRTEYTRLIASIGATVRTGRSRLASPGAMTRSGLSQSAVIASPLTRTARMVSAASNG